MQLGWVVWGTLAAVTATGCAALMRTRWLESRTLEKCVGLSLVIHAAIAAVCGFVGGLPPASRGASDEGRMTMQVVVDDAPDAAEPVAESEPPQVEPGPEAAPQEQAPAGARAGATADVPPADVVPLLDVAAAAVDAASGSRFDDVASTASEAVSHRVPPLYADREAGRRAQAAAARGGSAATEEAVAKALGWLVLAQSADGRWDAARHGAGRGRITDGQHRPSVGTRADHGVTGLALLAFLGAGHTHRQGDHAPIVEAGLGFLTGRQRPDGSLAGEADFFAALYCHGMATLAVAEAAALTGDVALRGPLERAVRHTLATQHPGTGGWRYTAGDRGDTSQFGWQVMALASARQAGVTGLEAAETRARGFLPLVSSGAAGGLAAYRSGERPSVAMTAEAVVCRLFLGLSPEHPAVAEGIAFVAASPPVRGRPNAYEWYYATLASFHAGGPQWEAWNARLLATLLPLQRGDGSWDPDPVWGGHGGRVYSTALAALMLEVYYRHRPLHGAARVAAVPP
jgi:hypothetical protein